MTTDEQFGRKATLILTPSGGPIVSDLPVGEFTQRGLDLSAMNFRFRVEQADFESPNNAWIRVFNLKEDTAKLVQTRFRYVVLQAGYEKGNYGVIFQGDIKQYRLGRINSTDTYLDILAADGDLGYNFGMVNQTFASGSKPQDSILAAARAMNLGIDPSRLPDFSSSMSASPALPRSKVGYGMARDLARKGADSLGSSWSIQGGELQVIPLQGYLPGEAVVLNSSTGMVGIPEQTELGIAVRSLLNARMRVGALVKLNSKDINKLIQLDPLRSPMPFNQYTGIQYASKIAEGSDGLYRIYVIASSGDTRGDEWYSDLVCLAINQPAQEVEAPI